MRTNERWIAGVAGGVAHRFDLDPTLVRCVWVVLSLFAGVGLVLYGLAWALLPEESDGRIHLEGNPQDLMDSSADFRRWANSHLADSFALVGSGS